MNRTYQFLWFYMMLIVVNTIAIVLGLIFIAEEWIAWTIFGFGIVSLVSVGIAMFVKILSYDKDFKSQKSTFKYDYNSEYLRLRDLLDINVPGFKLRTDDSAWSINERTIVYRLRMSDSATPTTMLRALSAIKTQLYTWRKEHGAKVDRGFNIVFDDMPPCLIVPKVNPTPMLYKRYNMPLQPFHMLVGKDYSGESPELISVDLRSPDGFTTLMGASSGGGKTTLLRSMLCSLLEVTSPQKLHLHVIDIEGKGLAEFQNLPHTVSYISTVDGVRNFMTYVRNNLTGPEDNFDVINLIVCDELMSLTEHNDITNELVQICTRMRSYGWAAFFVSQVTQGGAVPTTIRDNIQCRIAGRCKRDAQSEGFLGKGNKQAVQLPRGSFIVQYDDYEGMVNTYFLDKTSFNRVIKTIRLTWRGNRNQLLDFDTVNLDNEYAEELAELQDIPPVIRQLLDKWIDVDTGKLKRNGKATIMRTLLNLKNTDKLPSGTTYTNLSKQIDQYVLSYIESKKH